MTYKYFVSYHYTDGTVDGFDNAIITPPEGIKNMEMLRRAEIILGKAYKHTTVKILYFQEII